MKTSNLHQLIGSMVFVLAICSLVNAQDRTFVSGTGNDGSPCTRKAPCRTFQRGYNVVTAGGEVVALDSAGYGSVTITKSVTLTGEGVNAGIPADSTNGITINSATAVVVLRNLSIYGFGTGINYGILVLDAASLHVEHCTIQGFSHDGLVVGQTANSGIQTFVKDTVLRNNIDGNEIGAGKAIFENSAFEKSSFGLALSDGARATLHNCVVAGNSILGLFLAGTSCQMMVDGCQISNNGIGIQVNDGQVRVSNSQIMNNTTGLSPGGGTILSRATASGDLTNTVEDNGTDGAFSGVYFAK